MAGNKYVQLNTNGSLQEVAATQASAGATDANKLVALNSAGQVDMTMLPTNIGPDVKLVIASENLAAGDMVNVFNDSGTLKARKADASQANAGYRAHGFVLASVTANGSNTASVYVEGIVTGLSSLTPGATYFLSGTAGAITTTAPTTAGHCVQEVGVALSDTELAFEAQQPVIRA